MDKPQSLSVKDYLVRKLAVSLMVSEKVIDAVVTHQFSEANDALSTNDSVEISGFGKFCFNKKKAMKRMEFWLMKVEEYKEILANPEISSMKRQSTQTRLTNTLSDIEILKPKLI